MQFALWEQLLLLACLVATGAVAVRELRPKLRFVLAGAPERPRTDRIPERLLRTLREVLLQTRVIGGRPVVGSLHAVVFFGFLCFGLETTDHFLEPFGIHLLATLFGDAEAAFKTVLAGVSALVIIGIGGLFYRRFFMPSISPGPKSYTSGVVAIMIILLMLTYLYGLDASAPGQRLNWWLHALLIMGFVPLILHSKHFHIVAGPINVFLRNHRLGAHLPLDLEAIAESDDEVSLGLETVDDLPWKMRLDFLSCVECKRCTDNCPAANSGQELQPREFILAGRATMDSDGPIVGNVISETALGQCTSCGACENICPVGIEHTQFLIGAKRAQAMAIGQGMVADEFLQTVERSGNAFAAPKATRRKLIEELGVPYYEAGKTDYLLWLGCVWSYNEESRSSLDSLHRLLSRAGVSYGVLEEESCSGHHSRRQGEEFQFQTLAAENMQRFSDAGVSRIVSPCPHCLHTFRREYPTLDDGFRVDTVHHSELLLSLQRDGQLPAAPNRHAGRRVTYHDPCYLGRYEGIYEPPRDLIASTGGDFHELPRHGSRSFCCGGGAAGFAMTQERDATRVDQVRKQEVVDSGAEVLVTSCPECKMMLGSAAGETLDIAEFLEG